MRGGSLNKGEFETKMGERVWKDTGAATRLKQKGLGVRAWGVGV